MGANVSKWSDLEESEALLKLVGDQVVDPEDPFWNGLFSTSVRRPQTRAEWSRFEIALQPLLVNLIKNQGETHNLSSLVDVLLLRQPELKQALEAENSLYCWQFLNGLFVLRMALKGLVELCEDENQFLQCLEGTGRFEKLLKAVIQTINMIDEAAIGISYHLQLESVQLIIMVLSSPLFGRPSKILDKMLQSSSGLTDLAPKLSRNLCQRFIANEDAPPDIYEPGSERAGSGSLVLSFASGLWNILTFGYSNVSASAQPPQTSGPGVQENENLEIWSKNPLADLSQLLLLLLINHSSSSALIAEAPAVPEDHCYRLALYHCYSHKDSENDVSEPMAKTSFPIDFTKLFHALNQATHTEEGTLLLYTLLHRNEAFKSFVLASSDVDLLVVPLLKTLYSADERNNHHTYMSLIILLILSEDEFFNGYVHDNIVKDVDWYGERVLGEVSLGGIIILVVIRTIQHNMLKMRDKYLHANCLAALANMSNQFKNLHPYVCQRILSLFEALSKRYYRLVATLQVRNPPTIQVLKGVRHRLKSCSPKFPNAEEKREQKCGMDNFTEEDKEHSIDVASDAGALEEVLRMILEIINSTLISQNKSNSNFIYTLLYHQHIFEPFHKHPNFQDLLQNIKTVIDFYNKKLEPMKEGTLGVEEMQEFIRQTAIQFPTEKLKKFPDLRFKYVEEEQPEDFFVPYTWSLIKSKIYWNPDKISLRGAFLDQ